MFKIKPSDLDLEMLETVDLVHKFLRAVAKGQRVAVICRGRYDAKEKAEKFFLDHCVTFPGFTLSLSVITMVESSGCIEFCWLEGRTGRGAPEFDFCDFMLQQ